MADQVDKIIAYEADELNVREQLELFAELIKSGMAFKLQGHYGRTAMMYINNDFISKDGVINEATYDRYKDDL